MKTPHASNRLRTAFTLIEVLVSVAIISVAIVYVLQIYSENRKYIIYLSERNKVAFQDSLFLTDDALKHHKNEKSAYDLIERYVKVDELNSREILKEKTRSFFIPQEENVNFEDLEQAPQVSLEKIHIKGKYASTYYRFKMNSF